MATNKPPSDSTPPQLKQDFNPRVKELVGAKGLLPVFLSARFYEAEVTILAVEPSADPQFDLRHAIDYSQFTVRYEEGMLIEGKDTGVYWGSRFSKLGGV
jgi:hypothetical protein